MERRWCSSSTSGRARELPPSFSSSLLDAISRSIDDCSDHYESLRVHHHRDILSDDAHPRKPQKWTATARQTTSNSSDSSTCGGFSSSDAESSRIPAIARRLRSLRMGPKDRSIADPPLTESKKKIASSIRGRFTDMRRPSGSTSPAARLASFLNSLFASASGGAKKTKIGSSPPTSASSFTRSCMSKAPSSPSSTGELCKRSVRFCPVGVVVGEDSRPCTEKPIREFVATDTSLQRNSTRPVSSTVAAHEAAKLKRVSDLLLGMEAEMSDDEDENDDDMASDASSDLFELENLTMLCGGGGGGGGVYRDELPVYETTTFLGNNRLIPETSRVKEYQIPK